ATSMAFMTERLADSSGSCFHSLPVHGSQPIPGVQVSEVSIPASIGQSEIPYSSRREGRLWALDTEASTWSKSDHGGRSTGLASAFSNSPSYHLLLHLALFAMTSGNILLYSSGASVSVIGIQGVMA